MLTASRVLADLCGNPSWTVAQSLTARRLGYQFLVDELVRPEGIRIAVSDFVDTDEDLGAKVIWSP